MENYTKEELETIIKAFKILRNHKVNDRQAINSIENEIKEKYIEIITNDLMK